VNGPNRPRGNPQSQGNPSVTGPAAGQSRASRLQNCPEAWLLIRVHVEPQANTPLGSVPDRPDTQAQSHVARRTQNGRQPKTLDRSLDRKRLADPLRNTPQCDGYRSGALRNSSFQDRRSPSPRSSTSTSSPRFHAGNGLSPATRCRVELAVPADEDHHTSYARGRSARVMPRSDWEHSPTPFTPTRTVLRPRVPPQVLKPAPRIPGHGMMYQRHLQPVPPQRHDPA